MAKERGISIETLADDAEVSRSMLWDVLAYTHAPNIVWLLKIANVLKCKLSDLVP